MKPIIQRPLDALDARIRALETRVPALSTQVTALSHQRYLGRQVLTGSGDYVPTRGTVAVLLRGVACGGGGGGAGGGANAAGGGGGASGEMLELFIGTPRGPSLSGGPYSAPLSGGFGGPTVGGDGGAGQDASITVNGVTYVLKGGLGGHGMTSTAANGAAIPGRAQVGTVSTGMLIRQDGTPGWLVNTSLFWGGAGGSTPLGAGGGIGDAAFGSTGGRTPSGYGGGGGGACVFGSPGFSGSAGGAAVWIVDEFGG